MSVPPATADGAVLRRRGFALETSDAAYVPSGIPLGRLGVRRRGGRGTTSCRRPSSQRRRRSTRPAGIRPGRGLRTVLVGYFGVSGTP
jgi:hypothetical protein